MGGECLDPPEGVSIMSRDRRVLRKATALKKVVEYHNVLRNYGLHMESLALMNIKTFYYLKLAI